MATSSLLLQSYFKTASANGKNDKRSHNKKVKELLDYNKKTNGGDFLTPLNYYLDILEDTDQVLFPYMNPEKKQQLLRDLQVTFLLLLTQRKYEQDHQKTENVKKYTSLIKNCHQLIDILQYEQVCKERKTRPSPEHGYSTDGYPVKYLGLSLGRILAEQIVNFMDRKTKTIKAAMGAFNEKRLYWVWGSGLIKTMLELLPDSLEHLGQAKDTIKYPDPYTGALSWGLYYFRFSLNLSLLLKHTIQGPWMSEEEKSTPWTERFLTQWDQRKFTLLNDSVWATGNLVCYFWLTGPGTMGTLGDALTLALLIFDISLAVWEYVEEQTRYNKEITDYETNIKLLEAKIKTPKNANEDQIEFAQKIKEYTIQLNAIKRAHKKCINDWKEKNINLILNISYAVGLMLAFFILAAPFVPALAFLAPVGAVLCFALTILFNAVKGGMELGKTKDSRDEMKADLKIKITAFKALIPSADVNDNERKFLFLEIKKLMGETKYQEQMVNLQTAHLIRSIIFEAIIPAIILTNLVFFPIALLPALAGAFVLAACSNFIINAVFTPDEKEKLKPFNELEYDAFCKNPDNWMKKIEKSPGFFNTQDITSNKTPEKTEEDDADYDIGSLFRTDGLGG